jgi:GH35 family endo-1,4-beta-xylanase
MEAHLNAKAVQLTESQILRVMKAYAAMGVQVQITEFDIQVLRSEENDWTKASSIAKTLLQACVHSLNCTAFNNWGFSQAFYANDSGDENTVTMLPWDRKNQMSPEYATTRAVLQDAAQ